MPNELTKWYKRHGRDLPWRESKDPYRVFLSEIMLQQTRVEAVKGYFDRFVKRFPDIASLAAAEEEEVLLLWKGLGYYSRARNLRKCAIEIQNRFDGVFPTSQKALATLPGIGAYTSSAIASICFDERVAAVDGNLYRVYARLNAVEKTLIDKGEKEACATFFESWMDADAPGDINQALMDLGELVCLPNGAPKCNDCPLAAICSAHKAKEEQRYPAKKAASAKKSQPLIVFLIRYEDKYLIRKRPDKGLLASLYEFPCVQAVDLDEAKKEMATQGLILENIRPIGRSQHVFTHLRWDMVWYAASIPNLPSKGFVLALPEEIAQQYAIPSAFSFGLKAIN